jgi:hypothetical protein
MRDFSKGFGGLSCGELTDGLIQELIHSFIHLCIDWLIEGRKEGKKKGRFFNDRFQVGKPNQNLNFWKNIEDESWRTNETDLWKQMNLCNCSKMFESEWTILRLFENLARWLKWGICWTRMKKRRPERMTAWTNEGMKEWENEGMKEWTKQEPRAKK